MGMLANRITKLEQQIATGDCICNGPSLVIRSDEKDVPPATDCPVHPGRSRLVIITRTFGGKEKVQCAT